VEFVHLLPPTGTLVTCVEDAGARRLLHAAKKAGKQVVAYSLSPVVEDSNIEVNTFTEVLNPGTDGAFTFEARVMGDPVTVSLQVPGRHNVSNALGVLSVIRLLGLDLAEAGNALGEFRGAGRRFELRGEVDGVTVIDDYAHHPTEIRATLSAARCQYPDCQIWAVWQPHTYSRTRELINDFKNAFNDCDHVIVTEIYASREKKQDYSSNEVVKLMRHPDARQIADLQDVSAYLIDHLKPGDVLLVLSAGDADLISKNVINALRAREKNKR
jgi:UDP-N-acetylmuramate--alanine ligase